MSQTPDTQTDEDRASRFVTTAEDGVVITKAEDGADDFEDFPEDTE